MLQGSLLLCLSGDIFSCTFQVVISMVCFFHHWAIYRKSIAYMYNTPIGICCDTLCRNVRGCVLHLVHPTRIHTSPESSVPNNESTSCLINVRGEEECCILGAAHQHLALGDTTTESPWVNSGKAIAETRQRVTLHFNPGTLGKAREIACEYAGRTLQCV